MARIGIDLGGTKTEGVVLSDENRVLNIIRRPTPQEQGYSAILNNIKTIVWQLENSVGVTCSVGIGTPGSIDNKSGLLKYSNTICLNNQPLLSDLQSILKRKVRIENDANCFTLSESIDGAAQKHNIVFGVILGTGVGGGIVINRKILKGHNKMAGEWGHSILDDSGTRCYCGLNGCIETFLSGPGLINSYIKNGGPATDRVEQIIELTNKKDCIAVKTLDQFYTNFARAICFIIKILDPNAIVIGGGLSNIDGIYTTAAERINNYFSHPVTTNILKNKHGDSSGVRGAAFLWE